MTVMNMPESAAGVFVSWRASTRVVDLEDKATPIKVRNTKAVGAMR
jgi:hypothetical protein